MQYGKVEICGVNTANLKVLSEKEKQALLEVMKNGTEAEKKSARDKMVQGKMTKKLKTIFCDKHIPSHMRDKIPLLCDDKGILYIPTIATRDGAKGKNAEALVKVYKLVENQSK